MAVNEKKLVTKAGMKKIKDELKERTTTIRKSIADKLDQAKSMGDLSENSAYHAALEDYQLNETRIKDLKRQIQTYEIAPDKSGDSKTDIGDKVIVKDLSTGDPLTYFLVGEGEGDPQTGHLSVNSVLGKELVGRKKGEKVKIVLPSGEKTFEIISVD